MDPYVAALVILLLIVLRFMLPAAVIFTFGKLVDRYFPAN